MQVDSETAKTKTINRTLNPKWKKERHTMAVRRSDAHLEVSLWDWDTTSEDDFMGSIKIPIKKLLHGNEVNKWYKLPTGKVSCSTIFRFFFLEK